jgi:hypothetical protein
MCVFLIYMRATCSVHRILLGLISLPIFSEEYKLVMYSLSSYFLHPFVRKTAENLNSESHVRFRSGVDDFHSPTGENR